LFTGGAVPVKAAIDTGGTFVAYYLSGATVAKGDEVGVTARDRICLAAMTVNEICWAVEKGATPAQAATYETREAWRHAA
jgi:hypothetical protein